MQELKDKQHWISDEKFALVVEKIFSLCLAGYGDYQIVRIVGNEILSFRNRDKRNEESNLKNE